MAWCDYHEQRGSLMVTNYCLKKQDFVSSEMAREYCQYGGRNCPIKEGSGTGCYLTTACVEHKGLADDCFELSTLRSFRDAYMSDLPGGKEEVQEYYKTAPKIVEAINNTDDSEYVYEKIYADVIEPCVKLIQEGKNEEAHRMYKEMVTTLKEKYF